MTTTTNASPVGDEQPDPRRWVALAVLLIAGFMNLIDITIVNVALPSLQHSLGANSSQVEWIVAGYVLAFALGLLPFGRLGDIIGKRIIFIWGVVAFTVLSAACGFAPNIETLVVARLLQGMAGAMMMPQVMSIMQNIFPPHERGAAFAMFGLTASIAAVTGPLMGGSLIALDLFGLDWRPIFLINVPIGIFAVIAGLRLIPVIKGNPELSNDWVGILIVSVSVFLLIFPLVEGHTYDWPLWCFAMMVLSAPGFFAFVLWERARDRVNKSQLLPISLLFNRNYMVGVFATMSFFSGLPGLFMILALFLQNGFGLTPLESGLTTMPFPIGIFISSGIAGRIGSRFLKQRLIIGTLIVILGMYLTRNAIVGVTDSLDVWIFAVPLLVAGLGMGTTISVMFQTVLTGVPHQDAGSGSGGLQAFQQMGGAIGVAIIGEIFFSTLSSSGGRPDHATFIEAAGNALYFNFAILSVVIVLALFLTTPSHDAAKPTGAR